jgi:hypothetical protein
LKWPPGQRVYHATDLVMRQPAIPDTPLDPNETVGVQLAADENGNGEMQWGYSGSVDTTRTDLQNGETVS